MGRLSHYFDIPAEAWQKSLEANAINKKAFDSAKIIVSAFNAVSAMVGTVFVGVGLKIIRIRLKMRVIA